MAVGRPDVIAPRVRDTDRSQTPTEHRGTAVSRHPAVELPQPPGFSLAAASRFVMAFPAADGGEEGAALNLAFALDRTWEPVGVRVHEDDDVLRGDIVDNPHGADPERIRADLVRILNLHVDDDPLVEIGARDPVVERLRRRYAGLRPVQFPTPWEAAAWAVIGQRIRITQAATTKRRISERLGLGVVFPDGQSLHAFPAPATVASRAEIPGVTGRRLDTLKAVAEAAAARALDSRDLADLPAAEACARVQQLHGIGPFSAELILIRGVGHPDLLPAHEPRLARAMTALYGTADPVDHARIAEAWRPFRAWTTVLIRRWLEDETGEIRCGAAPGRGRRRDAAPPV